MTSYLYLERGNIHLSMDILKRLGVSISDIQRNSETDVEHKITVPFLEKVLGFTKENGVKKKFRVAKNIPVGSRMEIITPDIAVNASDVDIFGFLEVTITSIGYALNARVHIGMCLDKQRGRRK